MSTDLSITPEHEARAAFMAQAVQLYREIVIRAERLAQELKEVPSSQVRGLTNALGSGPERRTLDARRSSLASFLAWRAHRDNEAAWVDAVHTAVVELEQRCDAATERVRGSQEGYWEAHAEVLEAGQAWLRMEIVEAFVHALERRVMALKDEARRSSNAD